MHWLRSRLLAHAPLAPPDSHGPIRLAPDERWCRACGADIVVTGSRIAGEPDICGRCGSADLVPAASVLRPDEYILQG